jgi:hypothetical protein
VRVVGNTTSSHLAGAKSSAYGKLETFPVRIETAAQAVRSADFVKIDAEGNEAKILLSLPKKIIGQKSFVVEIGTPSNRDSIWLWARKNNLNIFSQKKMWKKVIKKADMPKSYKEGSIWIGKMA